MMVTPDGYSRLEISTFINPPTISDHRTAPMNLHGYLRVMCTVEDIDDLVSRLLKHGATLVGELVQYENSEFPTSFFNSKSNAQTIRNQNKTHKNK